VEAAHELFDPLVTFLFAEIAETVRDVLSDCEMRKQREILADEAEPACLRGNPRSSAAVE
jgi:hypothetical protein